MERECWFCRRTESEVADSKLYQALEEELDGIDPIYLVRLQEELKLYLEVCAVCRDYITNQILIWVRHHNETGHGTEDKD